MSTADICSPEAEAGTATIEKVWAIHIPFKIFRVNEIVTTWIVHNEIFNQKHFQLWFISRMRLKFRQMINNMLTINFYIIYWSEWRDYLPIYHVYTIYFIFSLINTLFSAMIELATLIWSSISDALTNLCSLLRIVYQWW